MQAGGGRGHHAPDIAFACCALDVHMGLGECRGTAQRFLEFQRRAYAHSRFATGAANNHIPQTAMDGMDVNAVIVEESCMRQNDWSV
jgi:hypothetical protein